jgi:hypothetical protein
LEVSLGVLWPADFLRVLREAKAEAATRDDGVAIVEHNGVMLLVHPSGAGKGWGYCHFRVDIGGYGFLVKDCLTPEPDKPNARLVVRSMECMRAGSVQAVWAVALDLLQAVGGSLAFSKVSRVDFAVDLADVPTHDLVAECVAGKVVTRAQKQSMHREGQTWTGYTVGTDGLSVNIYDKAREVKRDAEKEAFMRGRRWLKSCQDATRIEFRVLREVLRDCLIESVEELIERQSELAAYLFREWFRVTEEVPDRDGNNTHKARNSALWDRVVEGVRAVYGAAETRMRRLKPIPAVDVSALVKQSCGCLATAMQKLSGFVPLNMEEFAGEAMGLIQRYGTEPDYVERLLRGCLRRFLQGRVGVSPWTYASHDELTAESTRLAAVERYHGHEDAGDFVDLMYRVCSGPAERRRFEREAWGVVSWG